jgi:hypothetical protein
MSKNNNELDLLLNKIESKLNDTQFGIEYYKSAAFSAEIGAAAVLAVTIALEFSKGKKFLDEIREKIDRTINLLERVIHLLEDLKVFVREEFRYYVESELLAVMQTIKINDKDWIIKLESKKESSIREVKDQVVPLYSTLQIASRRAFRYGYKHFLYMINAYGLEIRLAKFLDKDVSAIKEISADYKFYFEECKSIDNPDKETFGTELSSILSNSEEVASKYIPNTLEWKEYMRDGECDLTFKVTLIITGSINTGFSYNPSRQLIRQHCTRGDGGRAGKGALHFSSNSILDNHPTVEQVINDYNYHQNLYNEYTIKATKLKECIDAINLCLDTISKVLTD